MKDPYPHWLFDDSPIDDPFGYGERAVKFLRRLKHPKSRLPGNAFQLDPWQERIVRRIYGPRNPDGSRVVKTVVLLIPRGNRKSSLSAAISLLHAIGPEKIPGGECVLAAADRKQASIAFKEAVDVVRMDKRLVSATRIYDAFNSAKKIVLKKGGSFIETISSDAGTAHGKSIALLVADELAQWRGTDLWIALKSSLPKVKDSLLVVATTSGRGQDNLAWEIVDRARKVATGEINDPSMLPILFETDAGADWKDEALLYRANPGLTLGYQDISGLRQLVREAETSMTARDMVQNLHLNVWLDSSAAPFVDMTVYDEGAGEIDLAALEGEPCWLGVDLSSSIDLSVIVAAFRDGDDGYIVVPYFFCPADNLRQRQEATGAPYIDWQARGLIEATPGNVIDFRRVEERVRELCETYSVQEIAVDPAMARNLMNNLLEDGLPAVEHRQGSLSMMPAIANLERAIVGRKFKHGGNEPLRFCFANVEAQTNSSGHVVRFTKSKKWLSIDGAVAAAMAAHRASAGGSAAATSLYDDPEWETALAGFN
ncbi:phage Terminase [Nitrobacter hamburgensis X14]|uniref:Phage Terminase n=1 Tax=Nitrobacter hamburgensis (strain DSM 10229 / NCIMB 13809 / X14) TaxID=323097 RepID=Q1QMK5_NITHX|nr:terminase TerL endonuclease subunit [Nitrobacter hamburgensis]ABE62542.1 phage Terminase [Nitrobacter hamburgensis X14]